MINEVFYCNLQGNRYLKLFRFVCYPMLIAHNEKYIVNLRKVSPTTIWVVLSTLETSTMQDSLLGLH